MLGASVKGNETLQEKERFGIPTHVHVCVTASGSVILDLKRDKYLGLGRDETEILANAVAGWPKPIWLPGNGRETRATVRAIHAACEPLVMDGLLQRIGEGQYARVVKQLKDMRGEWISIGDELEVPGRLTLRHVRYFLAAFCWARGSLALRDFYSIEEEIRVSKLRGVRENAAWHPQAVAALVDVFRQLRPFVFAAEGRCLLHALTLMKFLSHYQFYPEWVIGVTTQPWGAHSWVQWGSFLLDSNPEKVCAYTPIMAV